MPRGYDRVASVPDDGADEPAGVEMVSAGHVPSAGHAAAPTVASVEAEGELLRFKERVHTRVITPDLGAYFRDGWAMVMANKCTFVSLMLVSLAAFVAWLLLFLWAIGFDPSHIECYDDESTAFDSEECSDARSRFENPSNGVVAAFILLNPAVFVLVYVFPVFAGFFHAAFESLRNNAPVRFGDFFFAYRSLYLFKLLALSVLTRVAVSVGYSVFFVPGLLMQIGFTFAVPMHVEHSAVGIIGAIRSSCTVARRYPCQILGLWVLSVLVIIAGVFVPIVGLLFAVPVVLAAHAFFYHHAVGVKGVPLLPANPVVVVAATGAAQPQYHVVQAVHQHHAATQPQQPQYVYVDRSQPPVPVQQPQPVQQYAPVYPQQQYSPQPYAQQPPQAYAPQPPQQPGVYPQIQQQQQQQHQ